MSQDSTPLRDDADFVSRLHRVADEAKAADVKPVSALEAEALAALTPAPAPISCLGREASGRMVLWSREGRFTLHRDPERITWRTLCHCAGSEEAVVRWLSPLVTEDPPTKREMLDIACDLLDKECYLRGDLTPETRRGVGIWTAADAPSAIAAESKGWVYNSGAGCYRISPDGTISEAENYGEGYIYTPDEGFKPAPAPADAPLSDEEAGAVQRIITARTWAAPCEALLVSGWVLSSLLAGASPIRPHVSITAPAGSGKTALKTELEAIFPFCRRAEGGSTTEAAIRQMTESTATPLLFDEAEPSDDEKGLRNVKAVIRLSRCAFSGAVIGKGGADHVSRRFLVCFSAMFLAIRDAITDDADKSRVLSCTLRPAGAEVIRRLEEDRAQGFDIVRRHDYKARMLRRVLEALPAYSRNRRRLAADLRGRLEGKYRADLLARRVDVYSTLIASAWIWTSTGDITPDAIEKGIAAAEEMCRADMTRDDGSDAESCLAYLLRRTVRSRYGERTVATLARTIAHGTDVDAIEGAVAALETLGMRYLAERAYLSVDARKGNLKTVFKNSPWGDGNVASLLAENEGVSEYQTRFRGGTPVRALKIALAVFDEQDEGDGQ